MPVLISISHLRSEFHVSVSRGNNAAGIHDSVKATSQLVCCSGVVAESLYTERR